MHNIPKKIITKQEIGISAIFHFNKKLRSLLKNKNSDPIQNPLRFKLCFIAIQQGLVFMIIIINIIIINIKLHSLNSYRSL